MRILGGCRALLLVCGGLLSLLDAHAVETGLPTEVVLNGVEFVRIPGGAFWYTVSTGDSSKRLVDAPLYRHVRVTLDDYYIAKYEARASDFQRYMNAELRLSQVPSADSERLKKSMECTFESAADGEWRLTSAFQHPDAPAVDLSWPLADAFARWMGFRLPTEAEWQKAGRGPDDQRLWPWGNEYPDDTFGHFAFRRARCHAEPVTAYPKGRSPYGVFNMAGNVIEWVADWYNVDFDLGLVDGVKNPRLAEGGSILVGMEAPMRLRMGGRWPYDAEMTMLISRAPQEPHYFGPPQGVRFAIDASLVRDALAAQQAATGVRR